MDRQALLERIQRLAVRLGPTDDVQTVIAAIQVGEEDRAEVLVTDLEGKVARIERELDLERRIQALTASDEEVAILEQSLVLDGADVVEPRVKAAEDRTFELRLKAALQTPVGLTRFLGDWVIGKLYEPGDVVRSNGGLWLCVSPTKTRPPSKAWEVLVPEPQVQLIIAGGGQGGTVTPPPEGDVLVAFQGGAGSTPVAGDSAFQ